MYATGNKKMLNMLILDILREYSDEEHKLTQQEIIRLLEKNYDMTCDRRSVKNNIMFLKELGYDISMQDGYYLAEREFENAELRMLIDSVLFSKTISKAQSKRLVEKLKRFGNRYFIAKVSHVSNLPELQHSDNKQVMLNLDVLNDAIEKKRKIRFLYNEYGTDFKLHLRRDRPYIVNPYQLIANNGRYYLIGNYDKYNNVSHYRIDRMTSVVMLDEPTKPKKQVADFAQGFSLPKHMAEHIYMFSGESVSVKFKTYTWMMDSLVDWFGKSFRILNEEETKLVISVRCNEQAMLFWALQYGKYIEVLEPQNLRDKIRENIEYMYRQYSADISEVEKDGNR